VLDVAKSAICQRNNKTGEEREWFREEREFFIHGDTPLNQSINWELPIYPFH